MHVFQNILVVCSVVLMVGCHSSDSPSAPSSKGGGNSPPPQGNQTSTSKPVLTPTNQGQEASGIPVGTPPKENSLTVTSPVVPKAPPIPVTLFGSREQSNGPSLSNPRQIVAGYSHACALDDEGVKCWQGPSGSNKNVMYDGQLDVPSLKNPRAICAGGDHTCAIDDNGIKCWGRMSEYARSSTGGIPDAPPDGPNTYIPAIKNPRSLSCSANINCVVDDNGLKCWTSRGNSLVMSAKCQSEDDGRNNVICSVKKGYESIFGLTAPRDLTISDILQNPLPPRKTLIEFGYYNTELNAFAGALYVPPLKNVRDYAVSQQLGVCALHEDGTSCWGHNLDRQGYTETRLDTDKNYARLFMGDRNGCFLREDGSFSCFGWNKGYPGRYIGTEDVNNRPYQLKRPKELAVGANHICGIQDDGVYCWGARLDNGSAYPGPSEGGSVGLPKDKIHNPRSLAAGYGFNCLLDDDGVKCWGNVDSRN